MIEPKLKPNPKRNPNRHMNVNPIPQPTSSWLLTFCIFIASTHLQLPVQLVTPPNVVQRIWNGWGGGTYAGAGVAIMLSPCMIIASPDPEPPPPPPAGNGQPDIRKHPSDVHALSVTPTATTRISLRIG
jgi:hypothetical protein